MECLIAITKCAKPLPAKPIPMLKLLLPYPCHHQDWKATLSNSQPLLPLEMGCGPLSQLSVTALTAETKAEISGRHLVKIFLPRYKGRLNWHSSFSASFCLECGCLSEDILHFILDEGTILKPKGKSQKNCRGTGLNSQSHQTKPGSASPWTSFSTEKQSPVGWGHLLLDSVICILRHSWLTH